jgi:hypothetical protein
MNAGMMGFLSVVGGWLRGSRCEPRRAALGGTFAFGPEPAPLSMMKPPPSPATDWAGFDSR